MRPRIFPFSPLFNSGGPEPVASAPGSFKQKDRFDLEGFAKLSQRHVGEGVLPTPNAADIGPVNASQ
jgi:hypothetical protein